MTIRITKIDDKKQRRIVLRVEGKLHLSDAEIVEQVFEDFRKKNSQRIEIDLTAVSFLSSDSAAILKRIENGGAKLTGLDFFAKQVIETPE